MRRSSVRAIVGVALTSCMVLSSAFAPEHVHEPEAEHPQALVHRHFAAHHDESDHHDNADVWDHEGHVVWLDTIGVQGATYEIPVPRATPTRLFETRPASAEWIAGASYNAAPPHGPPRLHRPLRAPPRPLVLT